MSLRASIVTATLIAFAAGSAAHAVPGFRYELRVVEPTWSSGHPVDLTITLQLGTHDPQLPTPAQMAQELQLWDLQRGKAVPFDLTSAPPDALGMARLMMTPKQPLSAGHDYGVRVDPASKWSGMFIGLGGEWGATGANGEVGYVHIGG